MSVASIAMPRAPFFGSYVMETVQSGWKRENAEEKRENDARLKEIFETIDDYADQV